MAHPHKDDFKYKDNCISHMSYFDFLSNNKTLLGFLRSGYSGNNLFSRLRNPEYIHRLYIEKDIEYLKYLDAFKERFQKFDVIVMNPGVDLVHPDYLNLHFKNSLKILHFIDDPHTTYSYGLPFSWVFDAATYISPSYSFDYTMKELLNFAGFKSTLWTPHCMTNINPPEWTNSELSKQLKERNKNVVYVGGFYTGKTERLLNIKKKLKKDFEIYGKYPLRGLSFPIYSFFKRNPIFYLPKEISNIEREEIYKSAAVGVNMHLSNPSVETGNARLYELAYRGVAQVVDTSNVSCVEKIFEPDKEILTYTTIDECIHQVRKLLSDDDLRCKIALAAYERAKNEYSYHENLSRLINWFKSLK